MLIVNIERSFSPNRFTKLDTQKSPRGFPRNTEETSENLDFQIWLALRLIADENVLIPYHGGSTNIQSTVSIRQHITRFCLSTGKKAFVKLL